MNPPPPPPPEICVPSPLDKPLGELTEDDIAQLTREDCRRFLKQKGMRRPSWNKSQAIQQVISLKALLEDRPECACLKNPHPQEALPLPPQQRVEEPSPYRRKDPKDPDANPPGAFLTWGSRAEVVGNVVDRIPSPRGKSDNAPPAPQMTIFYGGNVNVYNNVPVEKASVIMQLAGSQIDLNDRIPEPVHSSLEVHSRINPGILGPGQIAGILSTSPVAAGSGHPEWTRMREYEDCPANYIDSPTGRQASLQRYREKRKDRYKGKRIIGGSPSSMEMMFLTQKLRVQTPNEQSSQSNSSSPTQPRPPCTPTRCSSIENQAQKFRFSVDLNDDGK